MLDWLSGIERKNLEGTHFVLSPLIFVQLLEGKADLDLSFFDTLSLPPQAAMKALPDLVDRLHAIKEVDLTKDNVGFKVAGEATMSRVVASTHHPIVLQTTQFRIHLP